MLLGLIMVGAVHEIVCFIEGMAMNSPFTSILFAVGLAVASQTAQAQPVVLPVKLADGTDTTLKLYLTLPSSPVLTETQTDGTHHDHFNVASSPSSPLRLTFS